MKDWSNNVRCYWPKSEAMKLLSVFEQIWAAEIGVPARRLVSGVPASVKPQEMSAPTESTEATSDRGRGEE